MLRVTTRQGTIMNFTKIKDTLKRFKTNRKGNVAITFGLAMVPIIFSIGAAVDYSRYSRGFSRMVSAGDTAILAASKHMTGSGQNDEIILKAELEEQFDKFMEANFNKSEFGINYTYDLTFSREADTVTVQIHGEQRTTFLAAMGMDLLVFDDTLGTRLEVTPENYVIDIVMCIDATGSMQDTLDAVQGNASTFNTQLRSELNIDPDNNQFKIRIRPIYFRDWEDERYEGNWFRHWYFYAPHGHYHWQWRQRPGGLIMSPDFYDLDDVDETAGFQNFLDSQYATGGDDLPEASGACLNEAMRSNWYDREETNDFPEDQNVTVFPIIVTWTDNAIQSLTRTHDWLSPTQPTSYASFETQWENPSILPQDPKLMILFGPETLSGWNTIKNWGNYAYGGDIDTGNDDAIEVIADNIIKTLPDVLRLTH